MFKSKINKDFNTKIIYNNKKLKFLGVFYNKKERIDKMNKFFKRVISAFMAFAVTLSMIALSGTLENNISAATTQNGTCGNNLTWTFDGSGTLTISGTGVMEDYAANFGSTTAPWSGCNITSVVIENGVTSVGNHAFYDCSNVKTVSIPGSVKSIGINAFAGCDLKTITVPEGVETIKYSAFANCSSLEQVILPSTVSTIQFSAFNDCRALKEVNIPQKVTKLEDYIFYNCALTNIEIPSGVESIGKGAFQGCSGLTTIEIPGAVTSIGYNAFKNCTKLATASFESNNPPAFGTELFDNTAIVNENGKIYVPCGSPDAYKTAANMSAYGDYITGGSHSFDTAKWKADNENHWHACTVCGAKQDEAPHIWSQGKCTECGYEKADIPIDAESFPDEAFRAYISKNIDTNGDGKLSDAEIQAVNKMYLYESRDGRLVGLGIKDLTGIGLFTELTDLSCDNNEEIISPDLSKNLKLVYLSLQGCNLTVLDVSMLTELKGLYLAYNSLKSLDLRQNTKLESLYCPFNQLVSIKLAENVSIEEKYFDYGDNLYEASGCLLDISELEEYGFDLSRASNWTSCKWIDNTHLLFMSGYYVQYDYDCGGGYTVKLSLHLYHNVREIKGNPATCTEDGTITYYHCEKCGYNFKQRYPKTEADIINNIDTDTVEPAKGHDFGDWEITSNPTFKSKGEATCYCGNDSSHMQTKELPSLSDTEFWKLYLDLVEDEYKEAGYEIPEDEYRELCEYYKKAPTLNDNGVYLYIHTDDNTNDSLMVELTLPSLNDKSVWNRTESVKPAENSEGEFVYTSEDYGSFTITVPALNDSTWKKDTEKSTEPTEDMEGKDVYHSDIYGDVTFVIPKLNHIHKLTHVDEVPATTITAGTKEHWHCEACGRDFLDVDGETEATEDTLKIGIIKNEVLSGENAPTAELTSPKDELIAAVLSSEEQAVINEGKDISIILKVEDGTDKASSAEKTAIESKIDKLKNYKLGQYLDIELLKKIGGEETEKITKTNSLIKITFNIPDALCQKGEYSVIRIHGSEITVLHDLDSNPSTVTIETDKFSTYALVYQEKSSISDPDESSSEPTQSSSEPTQSNPEPTQSSSEPTQSSSKPTQSGSDTSGNTSGNSSGEISGSDGNTHDADENSSSDNSGNPLTGSGVSLIPLVAILSGAIVVVSQKKKKACR